MRRHLDIMLRKLTERSDQNVAYEELIQTLNPLCAEVDEEIIRDIVSRMDAEYFKRFQPRDIAHHVMLAARLTPEHPCQTSITEREGNQLEVVIVAYDYFSAFAAICGLLSAYGLDIREGSVYTFAEAGAHPSAPKRSLATATNRRRGAPGLARKKIIDHFLVRPSPSIPFALEERRRFADELDRTLHLLETQRFQEVRSHVNRRLVETLGRFRGKFTGLLHPIQIQFHNDLSVHDTVLDIRSTDTPAFLYAFANALTMRGMYIRKAQFENVDGELRDRFYVRSRHGRKIETWSEQEELRLTTTVIKQFTHYLTWAPDPAKAIEYFDELLDRMLEASGDEKVLEFLKKKSTVTLLARLLGSSDFLWEDFLRRQHANLVPILETYRRVPLCRPRADVARELRRHMSRARIDEQRQRTLNQFKDREMFRIDVGHLMDTASTVTEFSHALTVLAEVVLEQAIRDCQAKLSRLHGAPRLKGRKPCPFAVFGMGKFGGRELGYASDLEVVFVYEKDGQTAGRRPLEHSEYYERLVQTILQWVEAKEEGVFHLDLRLRPHGRIGLLANSLESLQAYYSPSGLSHPFERQALIKLRFVAGDEGLGRQVEAHRNAFVYSDQPWDLAAALHLRERQVQELVEPGHTNVKYSPGGLIDVEYAVQYLQLMHGHADARLRTPNTLEALTGLGQGGVLKPAEVSALQDGYLFLRKLIDALRIVRGHAKDLVLPPVHSDEFVFLARRLGYITEEWRQGAARLEADIRRYMESTRELFLRHFVNS